jgi:hypothetical protein
MDIDLRLLRGDSVVVYFGHPDHRIDAYTFAQALIAFTDTARSVNSVLYGGGEIDVVLEAIGQGSIRALVRRIQKGAPGFLADGVKTIFWTAVGMAILNPVLDPPQKIEVKIETNEVIITSGDQRVIVPRQVYESMSNVNKSPEVKANVARTYRALQGDPGIENFGLTPYSPMARGEPPLFIVPQQDFARAIQNLAIPPEQFEKSRMREEYARLIVLKAWFNHSKKKWSFEWNGVPISAPIKDETFLTEIENRKHLFGNGDALDVVLTFKQNFVEELGVYKNDQNSYVVKQVIKPVPRAVQARL